MRRSTLGRGLASLIHEVPNIPNAGDTPPSAPSDESLPLPWPVEHSHALTPTPLRLDARSRLDKLSTRPRVGLNAARAYLDKLRQEAGRTSIDLDISRVDLTNRPMLSLTRERITTQTRYQFFGVSIWK